MNFRAAPLSRSRLSAPTAMRSFPSVDSGRQQTRASLGLGSGDRFGALRGGSRSFKATVERAQKLVRLQGKRATKRLSQVT
jgi:hypothetical protein